MNGNIINRWLFCGDLLKRYDSTGSYNERVESRRNVIILEEGGQITTARYHSVILSWLSWSYGVTIYYIIKSVYVCGVFLFLWPNMIKNCGFLLQHKMRQLKYWKTKTIINSKKQLFPTLFLLSKKRTGIQYLSHPFLE